MDSLTIVKAFNILEQFHAGMLVISEGFCINQFFLEDGVKRFDSGVIIRAPFSTIRQLELKLMFYFVAVFMASILTAPICVNNKSWWRVMGFYRLIQRSQYNVFGHGF